MKPNKYEIITCPHCGREYLPLEIFIPNAFMGMTHNIERDDEGKIVNYSGNLMNLTENYICDGCDKPFRVIARVTFRAEENSKYDFNEEYVAPIQYEQLTLFEDL